MADELERALRQRDLELLAESRNPRGVAPKKAGPLDLGVGLKERLAFLNQTFNPVEAIGQSMGAGERLMSGDLEGYDQLAALGDMLSGVASVLPGVGPLVRGSRTAVRAANTAKPSESLDELVSYNEQVRKGKGMLDRDKVSGVDNVLYRPDRAYRFIGPEGYDDFLQSGVIRPKPGSKQGYEVPYFMKGQSSGRYGSGEGGRYMVETLPDPKSWRGAAREFDADKYVGPSSPLTKDSPIRIFERGEDGQYKVIFDNIGDEAFLPVQKFNEGGIVKGSYLDNDPYD